MARMELTGQRFGRLEVKKYIESNKSGSAVWLCLCDCGEFTKVITAELRNGHTKSCGCLSRDLTIAKNTTHGLRKTKEYNIWACIKQRCLNPNNPNYWRYGGRGITVCERWKNSFPSFLEDMGVCPEGLTIDRIDNSKSYTPSNCRWANLQEQANNTRQNVIVVIDGEVRTLTEWAYYFNLEPNIVFARRFAGCPMEDWFLPVGTKKEIKLEIDGVTKNIKDWAKHYGLNPDTVYNRKHRGCPVDKLFLPVTKA